MQSNTKLKQFQWAHIWDVFSPYYSAFHFFFEFSSEKNEKRERFISGFHMSEKWLIKALVLAQSKKTPKRRKCVSKIIKLNKIKKTIM